VTEAGRLVGIVSLKDLLHFLELKVQLEPSEEDLPPESGTWQEAGRRETVGRR
jgi:hypothetical protein